MNIEYQDIITLNDNNKYIVASYATYNKITYLYLIDINNHLNIKIAELAKDNSLFILDDDEIILINILLPLFYKNSNSDIILENISES